MEVFMKKLLSIILALCLCTFIPAKAEPYDPKTIAGAVLTTAGVLGILCSAKLFHDRDKDERKLSEEFMFVNVADRKNKNIARRWSGYAIGLISFSSTTAGLVLLGQRLGQKISELSSTITQ